MRIKKGLVTLSVTMMLSLAVTPAFADNIDTIQQQLQSSRKEAEEVNEEILHINEKVNKAEVELHKVIEELEMLNEEIEITTEDLNLAEEELKEKTDEFNKRLRNMYKNGNSGYLEVLLSAQDLSDLLSRNHMVQQIASHDRELISFITEQKDFIEEKKNELETKKATVEDSKDEIETRKTELEKVNQEKQALMARLQIDIEGFESQYNEMINVSRETEARNTNSQGGSRGNVTRVDNSSNDTGTSAPAPTTPNVPAGPKANQVISIARNYLGSGYTAGGNGPNSFDCSGFTSFVYRQVGISLPRTTGAQASVGSKVSKGNLKPGDLLIFGNTYKSGVSHVGVYIGNGNFIHAANSRTGVITSSINSGYWSTHFYYGRSLF